MSTKLLEIQNTAITHIKHCGVLHRDLKGCEEEQKSMPLFETPPSLQSWQSVDHTRCKV